MPDWVMIGLLGVGGILAYDYFTGGNIIINKLGNLIPGSIGGGPSGASDLEDLFEPDSPVAGRNVQSKLGPMHAPSKAAPTAPKDPLAGRDFQRTPGPWAGGPFKKSKYADDVDREGGQLMRFSNGAEIVDYG